MSALAKERGHQTDEVPMIIPSVVTYGGQPVATDGDLVYLGGGVYAAAAPPPREPPVQQRRHQDRPRPMPGRVRPPAPRPTKPVVRSASAHAIGHPRANPYAVSDSGSPCPSRAQSDGQVETTLEEGPPCNGMGGNSAAGPRAWRPAGASRLPPPPEAPLASARRQLGFAVSEGLGAPGSHSEIRAEERNAYRREGILPKLPESQTVRREGAVGAPLNSDARAAERRAMREARVQLQLEERAQRLQAEAAAAAAKSMQRSSAGSVSAPELLSAAAAVVGMSPGPAKEDIEKQKLRVACKMEILDFFNGYRSAGGKMSAEQTRALLSRLQGSSVEDGGLAEHVQQSGQEQEAQLQEWSENPTLHTPGDEQSIPTRLQQVNDFCNEAILPGWAGDLVDS